MEWRDLYGLPLERFIPERGELAKGLRRSGHREDAARVAALRKPSVPAWAVNQLVRTQARAMAGLFDAGDALQRAQAELLAGTGDGSALRDARERERAAVGELAAKAEGLLSSEGHELTRATLDRVTETLHAAALDDAARLQVKDGCLERELRHVGLGASEAPGTSRAGARRPPARSVRSPEKPAAEPGAAARRAARARSERLTAARQAEAKARRAAERAARELETAQARRDRAAEALNDADRALAEARERGEEAARAHRQARQELDRA